MVSGVRTGSARATLAAGAPARVRRRRRPVPDWALGLAGVATMFLLWTVVVRSGAVSREALPYPEDTVLRVGQLLVDPVFLAHLGYTFEAWLVAMLVAAAAGVPLGLLFGYVATLYRPAAAVVHAGRSVPSTALIPIAILLFGLGLQMKVSLAVYAIFWPILLNAAYGVRDTRPLMLTTGRSLGWGRRQLLARIVLPSAAPAIATGLRIASSTAFVVVLSTELISAENGVGTVLTTYQQGQQPDYVYAGILIVGVLGMLLYYGFNLAERLLVPWGHAQRGGDR